MSNECQISNEEFETIGLWISFELWKTLTFDIVLSET